jgi:hypothetical protein
VAIVVIWFITWLKILEYKLFKISLINMKKMNKHPLGKLEILRPKPSPMQLIRIGGNKDGAYLLPDDITGIKACFSPGVSNRKDFEDELFDRFGIVSHMCDYSSNLDEFKTPLKPGQTFSKKWLDINGDIDSITLKDWVHELTPDPNDDLLLQIDIEGAEYRNLLNTPDAIFCRFRIIIIELHGLSVFNQPEKFDKELGPLLDRFDKNFVCVHAHPNNCCGEFLVADSKFNLPNVHELTFLRRDRWKDVKVKDCYPPMLPHPQDIPPSVADRAPIFLNEHWLMTGTRAPESTIKLLSDKVDYFERAIKQTQASVSVIVSDLHRLAQQACLALPVLAPKPVGDLLVDLALGKFFKLSSRHSSSPKECLVSARSPFFFHTGEGRNQSITIDLESERQLFELRITNRTDICQERARCLFYCLHDQPQPNLSLGYAVMIKDGFLSKENEICVTDLRGARSRYLTIYSPENTMLHFSSISIMGLPQ